MLRINTTRQELLLSLLPKLSRTGCVLVRPVSSRQFCRVVVVWKLILKYMALLCADGHCEQQKPKTWVHSVVLQECPNRRLEQDHTTGTALKSAIKGHYVNHGFWQISLPSLPPKFLPPLKRSHTWLYKMGEDLLGDTVPCLTATVHMLSVTVQFAFQLDRKITITPGHHLFHPGVCVLRPSSAPWGSRGWGMWCLGFYLVSEWPDTRMLCHVIVCHPAPFWNMANYLSVFVPGTNTSFSPEILSPSEFRPSPGLCLLLVKGATSQRSQKLIQRTPSFRCYCFL